MTQDFFQRQMDRLRDVFSDKSYPQARVELIWKAVRSLGDTEFEKVVDRLIGGSRYAPLVPDIQGAAREFMVGNENRRRADLERKYQGRACRWCGNSGAVFLTRRHDKFKFAVTCSCEWGRFEFGESDNFFHSGYLDTCDVFDIAGPQTTQTVRRVDPQRLAERTGALMQDMPGAEGGDA